MPFFKRAPSQFLAATSLFIFIGVSAACKTRTFADEEARQKAFAPLVKGEEKKIDFKLGKIESWNAKVPAEKKISYEVKWRKLHRPAVFKTPARDLLFEALQVTFGKINEDKYNALMGLYGGAGYVPFEESRNYEIIDFLPPLLQALESNVFLYHQEEVSKINEGRTGAFGTDNAPVDSMVTTSVNCWGTVYEIARFKSFDKAKALVPEEFMIFYTDRFQAEAVLKADTYSEKIGKTVSLAAGASLVDADKKVSGVDTGDVLIVTTEVKFDNGDIKKLIEHAAVYIDAGLYFEKTNAGEREPYRLSLLQDVAGNYVSKRNTELEFRRFNREVLPHPVTVFGDPEKVAKSPRYNKPLPAELRERIRLNAEIFVGSGDFYNSFSGFVPVGTERSKTTKRLTLKESAFQEDTFKFDKAQPRAPEFQ